MEYSKHRLDSKGKPTTYIVYRTSTIHGGISQRGVPIGDDVPKGYYLTEGEARDAYKWAKEVEHKEYLACKPEAEAQLDRHEKFIAKYLSSNHVDLGYTMGGDSHGIYEDYMYISVRVGRHCYERRVDF